MNWGRVIDAVVAMLIVGAVMFTAYDYGRKTMDSEWKARWSARDAADNQAMADSEAAERDKEQARQHSINKVIQDGQKAIDSAANDASAARATADGLRRQVDRLASGSASSTGSHSCTSAASQAASRAVSVLAELFKQADERSGILAGQADDSRIRGLNCEAAYQGIAN